MNRSPVRRKRVQARNRFRRLVLAWLTAAAIEFALLPKGLRALDSLDGLREMRLLRLCLTAGVVFCGISLASRRFFRPKAERVGILLAMAALCGMALEASFTWPFLAASVLILALGAVYVLRGWNGAPSAQSRRQERSGPALAFTVLLALVFTVFVSVWTVSRVLSFCAPTYDFGIFSQMFYKMRTTGLPETTLERDGLLSHFQVHVSPIYYLMLPAYCLFPTPATLQVLQALILASAVIPLWKLGKLHHFSPWARALLCALLLAYPAYSGGTGYDLHENAFLTPLLLWLFYGIDSRKSLLAMVSCALTLLVKEDAAVYTAVVGLWVLVRAALCPGKNRRWETAAGCAVFAGSVVWFALVTGYLAKFGDGVMTYRYSNFLYDGSSSLVTVIKAVILCPMKAVYECVDPEKLEFIALTMGPLLGLPLLTRRYERLILLIPYLLVNLMSDYTYQHDIFFQYTFGSTACLFYLVTVNLADLTTEIRNAALRWTPLILAGATTCLLLSLWVVPTAVSYPCRYLSCRSYYQEVSDFLRQIPEDASVTATTFYTVPLSQRDILYDVRYSSIAHILETQYIVLSLTDESSYAAYASHGENGLENLTALLEENGYRRVQELEGTLVIYQKLFHFS